MTRDYESMLIVRPDLTEEEREEIFSKVLKRIEDLKGKVSAAKVWAKERNFYYFLKSRGAERKKYFKGCYWLVNFALDTDQLSELKETIRLEERILRNIIVSREGKLKGKIIGHSVQKKNRINPSDAQTETGLDKEASG